ncbi:MAG: phospholipase D family protein [Tateyamaria sp.]|uniref:phospholipase D family protein n=1 Tax=Tateyamaria sp. TaxID=1929288 RepID=UPI00329B9B04
MRFLKWIFAIAVFFGIGVVAFRTAFPLPEENFSAPMSSLEPDWEGPLGQVVQGAMERNPELDGVRPLVDGRVAFAARAVLTEAAVTSIDVQYYIWQNDVTGLMLLDELRAAAERGVRVRFLVDDNGISGLDTILAELDAMPTASVRIFNPFTLRNPKLLSYAFDFGRLNRRMHNKSMTFDGVATIVGGRNVGDIYFDYGTGTHYLDVDAIAVGPIVKEVSAAFDDYWNSKSAYDAALFLPPVNEETIRDEAQTARQSASGAGYQQAIDNNPLANSIAEKDLKLDWNDVTLIVDDPAKGLGNADDQGNMVGQLIELASKAHTSLDLVSAYFIPGKRGPEILEGLARSGVKVRVLTNSLDATDVMPVHAAYMGYREDLLKAGVELLELQALRERRRDRSLPEILAGSASGLHAKVFAFDGERVLIGSYNLDPRSANLNTEMGFLIESPSMAEALASQLEKPTFAYRVELSDDGNLIWIEEDDDGQAITHLVEPETSRIQRSVARLVRWLPIEWML